MVGTALRRSVPNMRISTASLIPALALFLAASCLGPGEGPPARDTQDQPRPLYQLTGRVLDSATGRPLAQARIGASGTKVTTDSLGRYTVLVDSGLVHVSIIDPRYEPYERDVLVEWPQILDLKLRRLAPLITCFEVDADSVVAKVVDVQHRKTIHRSTSTHVILNGPGLEVTLLGNQWIWEAIDDFTYRMIVRPGVSGIEGARWHLLDKTGVAFDASCTAPTSCDHFQRDTGCRTPSSPTGQLMDRAGPRPGSAGPPR